MLVSLWIVSMALPLAWGSPLSLDEQIGSLIAQEGNVDGASLEQEVDKGKGKIWAVLVAGSYQFYNYRHQADICHAYQIFRAHGVPDENIIVMMYDDIATNPGNPRQGVIINKPDGPNVYQNVPKDYTGDAVTATNFLNVITGNKAALKGVGSGKVLNSGPNDRVFINLDDRGSTGLFAFPNDYLYATDLNKALKKMHKKKMYKKLLIYVESSLAGSMFDGILPKNLNILAVTAANATQGSYATYYDDQMETYLADLFSAAWMEDIDSEEHHKNLTTETITTQYTNVVQRTIGFSNPTMYGTYDIAKDHVTDFFGKDKKCVTSSADKVPLTRFKDAVQGQDVLVHTLKKKIQKRSDPEEKEKLQHKLDTLLKGRQDIEELFDRIISHLPNVDFDKVKTIREGLTEDTMPCYKTLVDTFNRECLNINKNTYALRHLFKFANICATDNFSTEDALDAFEAECGGINLNEIH